jgi:Prokaryotic cytochrome b561
MNDAAAAWPAALRFLHWLSAVLVVASLGLGVIMVQFTHDAAARFELTQAHKSISVAVLAFTIVRLCVRALTSAPKPEPTAPLLQLAAKTAHIALYVLVLVRRYGFRRSPSGCFHCHIRLLPIYRSIGLHTRSTWRRLLRSRRWSLSMSRRRWCIRSSGATRPLHACGG